MRLNSLLVTSQDLAYTLLYSRKDFDITVKAQVNFIYIMLDSKMNASLKS